MENPAARNDGSPPGKMSHERDLHCSSLNSSFQMRNGRQNRSILTRMPAGKFLRPERQVDFWPGITAKLRPIIPKEPAR
jgi:hypothetical protein